MQHHEFVENDQLPGKCTGMADDKATVCFEEKDQHAWPIPAEINPFLAIERKKIAHKMYDDMRIAEGIVREYEQWLEDDSLNASARAQYVRHRLVWEARVQALSDALTGLEAPSRS